MTQDTKENQIRAAILDLDGVVTDTASIHATAWKQTFDDYLAANHPDQPPFDKSTDYPRLVDGLPRLDGARAFLQSRGITLPKGEEDDTLESRTIRGIGNAKNNLYHQLLKDRGAKIFHDATDRIRQWRQQQIPVAVVSSSRNCELILETTGLTDLFDARVDGRTLEEQNLNGKPDPDMFLLAAKRIGIEPRNCAVFEDAPAGIRAAADGGFGLIVGVDRNGSQADALSAEGAHEVISTFESFDLNAQSRQTSASDAPPLLDHLDEILARLQDREPVLFLDYDGTLTPIVDRPEDAKIDHRMRDLLETVSQRLRVLIVSGRDRADVQQLVGIDSLIYAGSHGFDIQGPNDLEIQHGVGDDTIPEIDKAEQELEQAMSDFPGTQIERKRYSIALHYRNADPQDADAISDSLDNIVADHPKLRKTDGKKVFEIQPDIDWNKGKAVLWLIDTLETNPPDHLPIYIGDDTTDEDAFNALADKGLGILVADKPRKSAAHYRLRDVSEVARFLQWLADNHQAPPTQTQQKSQIQTPQES